LDLVDDAVDQGWSVTAAAKTLGISRVRLYRWQTRRALGQLTDRAGGAALHGLVPWEVAEILSLADDWGDIDGSHRKLAHRGSREQRVWVSPSTVQRVLVAHGRELSPNPARRRRAAQTRRPLPDWVDYSRQQLWTYDVTHFPACDRVVIAILDMVSRYWVDFLVSVEETSTQVEVCFTNALEHEGLLDEALRRGDHGLVPIDADDDRRPILLALSDIHTA
jgi:putative transposase